MIKIKDVIAFLQTLDQELPLVQFRAEYRSYLTIREVSDLFRVDTAQSVGRDMYAEPRHLTPDAAMYLKDQGKLGKPITVLLVDPMD